MATECLDVQHGDTLTRFDMVEGYILTVVGGGDLWPQLIDQNGRSAEKEMAATLATATTTAYRLAAGYSADPEP
jgi:hypothetical protein